MQNIIPDERYSVADVYFMNEELFNEATKSNVLSKKLIDQLQESMSYSSISFINWTIDAGKPH